METHKEIFTAIYDNNVWGGSGGGSMPSVNGQYIKFLDEFIRSNNIKSVLDYGCGDWQFSHLVNWSGASYTGYDCVKSVIDTNTKMYAKDNIWFTSDEKDIKPCDLLLIKDVFQHWSNLAITKFLDKAVKKYKYILITNSASQAVDNQDVADGGTRYLSASMLPLKKYKPEVVLNTYVNHHRETSLITCDV